MHSRIAVVPMLIAAVAGMALWFLAGFLTGVREPWDSSAYWLLVYPIAIAGCAFLGYRFPERPWRWPLVLFEAQFLGMCLRNGELGNLWPMGLALFAAIAIPGILGAKFAARLRERARREAA